jgi:poly(hydroxyalkanoate) granule-associated protein
MATKTKPAVVVEETNGKPEQNALLDALRKILLASIGAVALAQEEIEEFVERLIERGEIAEKDGRKLVHEVFEKRKKEAQKAEDEFSKRVESTLDRMSVPSKTDIELLSEKITELSKKIDELKKA